MKHKKLTFDPKKLTIVIICYNGEDIIEKTIKQALKHVPKNQVYVVSDASTDKTETVAAATGVHVFRNRRNVNKAFSISAVMKHVKTPYVLLLDDDTLIGKTFIPTSLLDEGYDAVAFNVMPLEEDYLINAMQRFEYRKSMQIGKNLRSKVGAIGNVSGAIGLFHTSDLLKQVRLHSGQFGGEDEQRTILVHLYAQGKGIAYTNSTVLTKAPHRLKHLFKQRAFSWNLSTPELFTMYWRLLLTNRHHFLLKAEKAYGLYIYATDPLHILFFWVLFTRPSHIFAAYGFYLVLSILVWLKTKRQDKLYVVLLFPVYSFLVTTFRFIGHFYWYKVKFMYFFKNKHHRLVPERRLYLEFMLVLAVNTVLWTTAVMHFKSDVNLLKRVQDHRLDEFDTDAFSYSEDGSAGVTATNPTTSSSSSTVVVSLAHSETPASVAHKIVEQYLVDRPAVLMGDDTKLIVESYIAKDIQDLNKTKGQMDYSVSVAMVEANIKKAQT